MICWFLFLFESAAADTPVDRSNRLRVEAMEDSISFATDSAEQLQGLLVKAKAALSRLYNLVFPKLNREKTLREMAEAFFIKDANRIEVQK